jgi:hypothetical protein
MSLGYAYTRSLPGRTDWQTITIVWVYMVPGAAKNKRKRGSAIGNVLTIAAVSN